MNNCSYVQDDEVCDLVQIDLARVRKIRETWCSLMPSMDSPTLQRARRSHARAHFDALSHGELCVCDLAAVLKLSQSAVSHQLRLLRGMRLVRPRRDGRVVFYSLDDQHIMSIFKQTLQHVEESASGIRPRGRAATARQVLKVSRGR